MKFALLAAAAVLAVPVTFAQTAPADDTTYLVAPGRTLSPSNSPVSQRPIPGAAIAQEHGVVSVVALNASTNTAVMGAAAAHGNRYWFNVPKNVDQREDFRRWRGLQ
ncbi:MAG: hypothetical protein JWP65_1009 [Ramlibacter sp.]|jgi:hypothetical protein|uniref:hypothetical protein n=1 Tax=Ramlibacter sp. TaxID=1917967 RepID=UPI00261A61A4|nr:hypothetical protein [Ramlibacter sp.]MDB5750588.1 hypothetical protein [Ramlibacter sp.]